MDLPTEIFGSVIVVHTPEEMSVDNDDEFRAYLPNLERTSVVLDVDNTELLDSRGLTAILDAQDALRDAGGDVKIAASGATNRKVFEITRLDQQIEVFESMIDAVKSFQA